MGQTSSKENQLFGYTTPPIESDNDFRCLHEDKQIVDEEIRLKIDRRQQMMDLSKRNIFTLTPNISILTMIKRLDLSNNHLNELPDAIGCLRQLEHLSVSDNNLSCLPDTICHLSRLKYLDFSRNQLQSITPYIGHLSRLQSLVLSHNKIDQLPFTFDGLTSLMLLDLSNNPISILPAQVIQLPYLRRIRLENCSLLATSVDTFDIHHNPPSLLEICARTIVCSPSIKENVQFTDTLENYLSSYNICSHCHGPYFDSFVSRGRWLERNDHLIPLEYRLCSAHWSDETDRVFATFSSSPSIQLPPIQGRVKPNLIGQKNKARTFYKKLVVQESTKEPSKVLSKMKKWKLKLKKT